MHKTLTLRTAVKTLKAMRKRLRVVVTVAHLVICVLVVNVAVVAAIAALTHSAYVLVV
jgi:hypothetical protein